MNDSVIVYRNPFERWIWEQGGLLTLSLCFLTALFVSLLMQYLFVGYNIWAYRRNHVTLNYVPAYVNKLTDNQISISAIVVLISISIVFIYCG